jgi:hypothetical protein
LVCLFGALEVEVDGEQVALPPGKLRDAGSAVVISCLLTRD